MKSLILSLFILIMVTNIAVAETCTVSYWLHDKTKDSYGEVNLVIEYKTFYSHAEALIWAAENKISELNITKEQGQESYTVWSQLPEQVFICKGLGE